MVLTDDLTVGDNADVVGSLTVGDITSDSTVIATTTVQGEQVTSTDDATITDLLSANRISTTTTANIGSDLTVVGDTLLNTATATGATVFMEPITVNKSIGTAPFAITSTTKVTNLNADAVDGKSSTDVVLVDGTQTLTANWDAGSYEVRAQTFESDVTTGTAPFVVASTTQVDNLNAAQVANKSPVDFVLVDGSQSLSADWDAGAHKITMDDLQVDDDANITGTVGITADLEVDGATILDTTTIDETLGVTGLTTVSAVAVGVNATTTDDTTLTSADLNTLYAIDASGASVTLTLPAANTVTGRLYMIATEKDMGDNNIVLATTGSGKIGGSAGADTFTSTDATATIQLISDGTNYQIVARAGTWS
jgi:hypothetical protein